MPIKGLTDSVQAAFPRIGKLRKGGEAVRDNNGNVTRMGKDLEYFRFTSERPEAQAAFEEAYGENPALVTAYLPYATAEANFACWKEKWKAGGLVHRCDGETMTIWMGPEGQYHREPKPCDGGCDEVGRLSLIIPELVKAGFVGYVTLETHGINDLLSIQASLLAAFDARGGNPLGLRGILWSLRRVKEKISTPMGNGKRARRDKWLVKLEPAADWVTLQLQSAHNATMMLPPPRPEPAQLTAGDGSMIDHETGEIVGGPSRDDDWEPPEPPFDESDVPEPMALEEAAEQPQQAADGDESHRADLIAMLEDSVKGKGFDWDIFKGQFERQHHHPLGAATAGEIEGAQKVIDGWKSRARAS